MSIGWNVASCLALMAGSGTFVACARDSANSPVAIDSEKEGHLMDREAPVDTGFPWPSVAQECTGKVELYGNAAFTRLLDSAEEAALRALVGSKLNVVVDRDPTPMVAAHHWFVIDGQKWDVWLEDDSIWPVGFSSAYRARVPSVAFRTRRERVASSGHTEFVLELSTLLAWHKRGLRGG